jgi:uncharacterized protein (DUF1800 family)
VRAVYREYEEKDPNAQPLTHQDLVRHIDSMGQLLFAPPNVKGWRGGKSWLNTSTVLARDNFAQGLAMGSLWGRGSNDRGVAFTELERARLAEEEAAAAAAAAKQKKGTAKPTDRPEEAAPAKAFDPARLIHEEKVTGAKDVVRVLLDLYLPGGVRPATEAKLLAFVETDNPNGAALDRRVRETVHAIMVMPEYHLA